MNYDTGDESFGSSAEVYQSFTVWKSDAFSTHTDNLYRSQIHVNTNMFSKLI